MPEKKEKDEQNKIEALFVVIKTDELLNLQNF